MLQVALWTMMCVATAGGDAAEPPRPTMEGCRWTRLPDLPCAKGVAGSLAGTSGGALLTAGGANFPGDPPWKNGVKVWYDTVFVLQLDEGADGKLAWRTAAQRLPRPLGYGVSATHRDAVVCVGGSNARGHFADAFRMRWTGTRLEIEPLPALPSPAANGCGAMVGDVLFVAGGQERPDSVEALRTVYSIDLAAASPRWRVEPPLPGPGRILSVAAGCDGAFWVVGGASLAAGPDGKSKRTYLRSVVKFVPGRGWESSTELPQPVVAAPSPAPADAGGFWILGADDGSRTGIPPERHPGFAASILRFDVQAAWWRVVGSRPSPCVTTPTAPWGERWIVPSGEIRPGVRSPEVWSIAPDKPR